MPRPQSWAVPSAQLSILVLALCSWTLPASAQNTIHVPTDYPTIQAAISAASDGDTVLVAQGTYTENINFMGKAITVSSSSGASTTIIDGGQSGVVVTFNSNETHASVLNGFTITDDAPPSPVQTPFSTDGILIVGASPTITNNVITRNRSFDRGKPRRSFDSGKHD